MSKIKYLIAPLVLSLFLIPNTLVLAQTDYDQPVDDAILYDTGDYEDYDYSDYNWEDFDSYMEASGLVEEDVANTLAGGMFALLFTGVYLAVVLAISLGSYIFTSLALMKIGQKLGYENSWFAWIPFLNLIMLFQLGDQNPWLLLLFLIPGIGAIVIAIISIIAYMRICEKRGYDKLLGLLVLIPIGNLILLAILAWKDNDVAVPAVQPEMKVQAETPVQG